jgi:hypothetical protein
MKPSEIPSIALGTPDNAVDFARRQISSKACLISVPSAGAPLRSLQRVLCDLLDSEINAGLRTFGCAFLLVWIGDELNNFDAEAILVDKDAAWADDSAIANWLHETAIRLYSKSEYARRHGVSSERT